MASNTDPLIPVRTRLNRLPQDVFNRLVDDLNYKDTLALSEITTVGKEVLDRKSSIMEYVGKYFFNRAVLVAAMADTGTYITGSKARDFFFPELEDGCTWDFTCTGELHHMGEMVTALQTCGVEFDSVGNRIVNAIKNKVDYSETVAIHDLRMPRELRDAMKTELEMSTDNTDARGRTCLLFKNIHARDRRVSPGSILIEYDAETDELKATDSSNLPSRENIESYLVDYRYVKCVGRVTFGGRTSTVVLRRHVMTATRPRFHECVALLRDHGSSDKVCFLGFSHAFHAYYDDTASGIIHKLTPSRRLGDEKYTCLGGHQGLKVHRIWGPGSKGSYLLRFSDTFMPFRKGIIGEEFTMVMRHKLYRKPFDMYYRESYNDVMERSQWLVDPATNMIHTNVGVWTSEDNPEAGEMDYRYMLTWDTDNALPNWMRFSNSDAIPPMLDYIWSMCDPESIPEFMQYRKSRDIRFVFHTGVVILLAQ